MKKRKGLSKQSAFLAAYARTASITLAAAACKIQRQLHYRWLYGDPAYPPLFLAARTEAGNVLVDEAVRRAHDGTLKPVFYKGKPVGAIREYDGETLRFLIRGFLPEYRESFRAEITGVGGGPIQVENQMLKNLNDSELGEFIGLARKAAAASSDGSGAAPPTA